MNPAGKVRGNMTDEIGQSVGKASLSSRYSRIERRMIVESPTAGLLPTGVGG
jgi:hypothetical protein